MELHPTIIVASGGTATELVSSLVEDWHATLGDAAEVVAFAVPAEFDKWGQAIREIHDVLTVARLQRLGHWIDPAINGVWLAELHDPELPRLLSSLEKGMQSGLTQGRELRLHMLLLLPDLFDASPHEQELASAHIELLRPTKNASFTMRVWPLSVRSRADLYIHDAKDLLPLVQYFIEACLLRSFPLHPDGRDSIDWAGLGCSVFAIGKPLPQNLAHDVWEEVKRTVVRSVTSCLQPTSSLAGREEDAVGVTSRGQQGSAGGARFGQFPERQDNVFGEDLEVPPCPKIEPDDIASAEQHPVPQRSDCFDHPKWETIVAGPWRNYEKQSLSSCTEKISLKVEPFERGIVEEGVRVALRCGLPQVEEYRRRLERALSRANAELDAALEPFDRLMGLSQGRRHLLRAAVSPDLRALIEEADEALDACDLEAFLRHDQEARQISEELRETQNQFELNEKQWKERFETKKREDGATMSNARRVLRWILDFSRRLVAPWFGWETPSDKIEEDRAWRKRHCDKAWTLVDKASKLEAKKWERSRFWFERWAEFRVRRAYRDALLAALERCRSVLSAAKHLEVKPILPAQPPLILTLNLPRPLVQPTVERLAQELVRERLLEELWDGHTDTLVRRLVRKSEEAIAELPEPTLEEMLDDDAWAAAFQVAAPRVMVAHRPEQEMYTLLYTPGPLPRFSEKVLVDRYWRSGGLVMFRCVLPIYPEALLTEAASPRVARAGHGDGAKPYSAGRNFSKNDDRPNHLLEEVFGANAA